jgi:hypothetical protein
MDTGTVRMLEGKLKSVMASVGFWGMQHAEHCDRTSHRCYREALVRAVTTADLLADLGIYGASAAFVTVNELLDNVTPIKE